MYLPSTDSTYAEVSQTPATVTSGCALNMARWDRPILPRPTTPTRIMRPPPAGPSAGRCWSSRSSYCPATCSQVNSAACRAASVRHRARPAARRPRAAGSAPRPTSSTVEKNSGRVARGPPVVLVVVGEHRVAGTQRLDQRRVGAPRRCARAGRRRCGSAARSRSPGRRPAPGSRPRRRRPRGSPGGTGRRGRRRRARRAACHGVGAEKPVSSSSDGVLRDRTRDERQVAPGLEPAVGDGGGRRGLDGGGAVRDRGDLAVLGVLAQVHRDLRVVGDQVRRPTRHPIRSLVHRIAWRTRTPAGPRPLDAVHVDHVRDALEPLPRVEDGRVVAEGQAEVAVPAGVADDLRGRTATCRASPPGARGWSPARCPPTCRAAPARSPAPGSRRSTRQPVVDEVARDVLGGGLEAAVGSRDAVGAEDPHRSRHRLILLT